MYGHPVASASAPRAVVSACAKPTRRYDLDWLRGLMLVLMTITHLPTAFSGRLSQPFGFVSAAEGFVFLSAFLVGSVYTRTGLEQGPVAMGNAIAARALKVYAAHAGLLLFLFFVLVPTTSSLATNAITDLASFYVQHPAEALASSLLLLYNPPLLDILPMYVVFLALTPWVLRFSALQSWIPVFAASAALWVLSQLGAGRVLYDQVAGVLHLTASYRETGAFSFLAWQLLWIAGLYAGTRVTREPRASQNGSMHGQALLRVAVAVAVIFFLWRHLIGQAPFGSNSTLNALFDKWHLGPLRLLNFVALAILAVCGRNLLDRWAQKSTIAVLGRASLAVFCAHLIVCLILLAIVGNAPLTAPRVLDAALLVGSLVLLYGVARVALSGARPAGPNAGATLRRQFPAATPRMAR
jgi:hypothetical protein